jgi:hypothetical protein
MVLESAQLLCSPFMPGAAPYKRTHYNHPCSVWIRESKFNYEWLLAHAKALSQQYTLRYGKRHKSGEVIQWAFDNAWKSAIPANRPTPFVQCMPEKYRVKNNPVQAYRDYYINEKKEFAEWNKGVEKPEWFVVS